MPVFSWERDRLDRCFVGGTPAPPEDNGLIRILDDQYPVLLLSFMLRQAQHERGSVLSNFSPVHPEPVEG